MKTVFLTVMFLMLSACGGGGSSSSTGSLPQLAASVADFSSYKATFADTTKIDGPLETASLSIEQILNNFKRSSFFSSAFANSLNSCNSAVSLVSIDDSENSIKYKKHSLTINSTDKPCIISSQEAGDYIAAQAKNLYQGTKKCDILFTPIRGGKPYCLEAGIDQAITARAGNPIFRLGENLLGIAGSAKGLGGRMTTNGKYFFIAFNNDLSDSTKTDLYDGVYRVDLTGSVPKGQVVYLNNPIKLDCPPCKKWSFGGFNPLENGDLIIDHYDGTSSLNRKSHYYVPVYSAVSNFDQQVRILINEGDSPTQVAFEADFINSPIFKWAKTISPAATSGDTMAPYFSNSQNPSDKSFITSIAVNKYKATNASKRIMVKATITNNQVAFEDLGGSSVSFDNPGHSWISDDLSNVYTLVTSSSPIQIDVDAIQLNQSKITIATNITPKSGYTEREILITENYLFISSYTNNFWNSGGEMLYETHSIRKTQNGTDWSTRPTQFQAVNMGIFTGSNYVVQSIIPSLSGNRVYFKFKNLSTNDLISADMTPNKFSNIVNLGSRGAVASNQGIFSRK
jgi:hypothetical protein